jgi:predicted peptidase
MRVNVILILLMMATITPAMTQESTEWNIPGKTHTMEFPELPAPFYTLVRDTVIPARMSVYLPENFSTDRTFPLFLWFSGGHGGTGANLKLPKTITENQDYISANFTLFKETFEPMKPDSSNSIWRWLVRDWDHEIIWTAYSVMLKELHERIPNIDRNNSVVGGFSNGAHTTVALLNGKNDIRQYFRRFIIADGGIFLQNRKELQGISLIIFNAENNDNTTPLKYIFRDLRICDIDVSYVLMDNADHSFHPEYYSNLREWLQGSWMH